MPEIITVINMKGGVGKTTLSVNTAYVLTYFHNKKVLIIDIDPQFNATQYLVEQGTILKHFQNKKTVFDILMPKQEEDINLSNRKKAPVKKTDHLDDYLIKVDEWSDGSHLHLIPSSLKLINFESTKRGIEKRLKTFIDSKCSGYDFIIIDCPPTLSFMTLSAYLASNHYLIPIKPDYLSSLGLPLLQRGLQEYEELYGHSLNMLGIVFTMVNNQGTLAGKVMQEIKEASWDCFESYSSQSNTVAKSVEHNSKSLERFYRLSSYSRYANEFKKIVGELISKL